MPPPANGGVKKYSQHTLMFLQVVAGAAAGAVAKTATGPLERIKILFQVQVCTVCAFISLFTGVF